MQVIHYLAIAKNAVQLHLIHLRPRIIIANNILSREIKKYCSLY